LPSLDPPCSIPLAMQSFISVVLINITQLPQTDFFASSGVIDQRVDFSCQNSSFGSAGFSGP